MIDLKWKLETEWWDESKEGRLDGLAKLATSSERTEPALLEVQRVDMHREDVLPARPLWNTPPCLFPYVCPEPVLAKKIAFSTKWHKYDVFSPPC